MIDELKEEILAIEEECSEWTYCGNIYKIPIFGACAPDSLLDMADKIDTETISGTPKELAKFIFEFVKAMLLQKNDIKDEDIKKMSNVKIMQELYAIWMGKGR